MKQGLLGVYSDKDTPADHELLNFIDLVRLSPVKKAKIPNNFVVGPQAARSKQSEFKQAEGLAVVPQVRLQAKGRGCFDNLFSG